MFKVEKLDLLIAIYIFCICAAEFMGAKTFPIATIFGVKLAASVAIFLVPLLFTINDVITEVYGRDRARSVIRSGLVVIFLILIFSLITTALPASHRFTSESAFDTIFGKSARIAAASLIAFALAEFLDVFLFVRIREKFGKSKLWLRTNLSNFGAQLIDTIIFMSLAFYAFDQSFGANYSFLIGLIIPYWLLKCFMSVIETPFVYLGVRWLKKDSLATQKSKK